MQKHRKDKNGQDAGVVLILGAALLLYSGYGFFCAKGKQSWVMSPYLFPALIAVLAVVLGLCMRWDYGRRAGEGERDECAGGSVCPVLEIVVRAVVYGILIAVIGFVPSTVLFLASLMWYMGERRWKVLIPVAVLTPLMLYLIFAVGLNVRLP